jgi:pyruvate ferredoxin oxidoreductase beta subunit/2-oxoisovalerate ferredoxin oxidoreductase beta subunit
MALKTAKARAPKAEGQGISKQDYETRELLLRGHLACPGCGQALAMRMALKALGPDTIVVMPPSCLSLALGPFPRTALGVSLMNTAFATAAGAAAGIRATLELTGRSNINVMAWVEYDDAMGGGLSSLALAAREGRDMIFVCCDRRPGGEGAPAYGSGAQNMLSELGASFVAATSPALPHDMMHKFSRAATTSGFRFIHVLAACPRAWGTAPDMTVNAMRGAVLSGEFPVYEIEGDRMTMNEKTRAPNGGRHTR